MDSMTVRSPYDGRELARVEVCGRERLDAAVVRACRRFEETRRAPAHARAAWCEGVAKGISEQADALADTISAEAGKPIRFAKGEVARAQNTFRCAAEEARRIGGEVIDIDAVPAGDGRLGIVRRFPRGPVLGISPFNFPLNLVAHKVAPALAVGNPVLLKPASATPLSALALERIVRESGAPEDMLQVLPCRGSAIAPLVADDRIGLLSFTGSMDVGWALKAQARRKHVALELGGNAAAVVEPDADLDDAASRIANGCFAYAGQVCISVQRILVHRAIYADFADRLQAAVAAIGVGDPALPSTVCGPLITRQEADRVNRWVEEAEAVGARRLCGGERDGSVLAPTLLSDVPLDAKVSWQEVFGPVATIAPYDDFEAALGQVNASRYGLQAGLYTNDIRKLMRAFETVEVGGLIHNDSPMYRVDHMPYGGVKESGFGREGLKYAIHDNTEPRLLVLRP